MIRLALGLWLICGGCSTTTEPSSGNPAGSAAPTAGKKDPVLARTWIASGAVVIDVRTAEEFATGHVDHAVNIPVEELPGRIAEVGTLASKDQPIVVYCASGFRAASAQRALLKAGYSRVVNGGSVDDLKTR